MWRPATAKLAEELDTALDKVEASREQQVGTVEGFQASVRAKLERLQQMAAVAEETVRRPCGGGTVGSALTLRAMGAHAAGGGA